MSSVALFINAFLSYFVQLLVFVAVGALGAFIGLCLRKNKNAKEALTEVPAAGE